MTVAYGLAPNIAYYVLNKTGTPAAMGFIVTRSAITGAPQATYADPAGSIVNPTVIRLGMDGAPPYSLYWATGSGVDLYIIDEYSADGQLIRQQTNYPTVVGGSGGGGDITVNNNVTNYMVNPQFIYWSQGTVFANDDLPIGSTEIADEWLYTRSTTNATVAISRENFLPGENAVPYSPPYYLKYSCTVAGSDTTNFVSRRIPFVQTLNNQIITESIYASVLDLGATSQLTLIVIQNFGTGGSSPVTTLITTFDINDGWVQYSETFTVPSVSGKTIGADGGYLEIAWGFKTNQIVNVGIADACGQSGTGSGLAFPYITPDEQYAEILPYTLAGESSQEGTNLVGRTDWVTLENWCKAVERTNFLIGWNFYNNPNQLGETISSVNNAQYVADQTIVLSDGNGVVSKSSFISQPLTLTVLQNSKKFGIFQIIEDINGANLRNQVASMVSSGFASANVTCKMAIIGWSGAPNAETRAAWVSANLPGTNPTLATGWDYLGVSDAFVLGTTTTYPLLNYLNNVATPQRITYGVILWNDGVELTVGQSLSIQNCALTLGNSGFQPADLPFQDVLLKCQPYYWRTYNYKITDAVGALTQSNSQAFYPQAVWSDGSTIKTIFPSDLTVAGTIQTYTSSLVSNIVYPVQMVKQPTLTFYNPYTGAAGTARVFVDTVNITYAGGSFDVFLQVFNGDERSSTIYFDRSGVISYTSTGIGEIVNAPILLVNITADALLGV